MVSRVQFKPRNGVVCAILDIKRKVYIKKAKCLLWSNASTYLAYSLVNIITIYDDIYSFSYLLIAAMETESRFTNTMDFVVAYKTWSKYKQNQNTKLGVVSTSIWHVSVYSIKTTWY